jgi:iron complex transport system ATP-binding protein
MLEAQGAEFAYPGPGDDRPRLGPFDVTVGPGSLVALIGPNGSGKSTLLRLLAGRLRPLAGTVTWAGRPVAELSPPERARRLAMVPSSLHLAFDLPVETLVELGRLHRLSAWERLAPLVGEHRRLVDDSLAACDLLALRHRSFRDLSSGEQQRVLLAMALAQDAPVLLLDEPTASLDPGHARRFMDLLDDLRRAGRAVVFSHHDVSLAAQYATVVLVLDRGRVAAAGDPASTLTDDVVSRVYDTPLRVIPHPDTGRPLVIHRADR